MAYKQKEWSPFTSIPEKKKVGPAVDISKQKGYWDRYTMYGTKKGGKDYELSKRGEWPGDWKGRDWTDEEILEEGEAREVRNRKKQIDAVVDHAFNRPIMKPHYGLLSPSYRRLKAEKAKMKK